MTRTRTTAITVLFLAAGCGGAPGQGSTVQTESATSCSSDAECGAGVCVLQQCTDFFTSLLPLELSAPSTTGEIVLAADSPGDVRVLEYRPTQVNDQGVLFASGSAIDDFLFQSGQWIRRGASPDNEAFYAGLVTDNLGIHHVVRKTTDAFYFGDSRSLSFKPIFVPANTGATFGISPSNVPYVLATTCNYPLNPTYDSQRDWVAVYGGGLNGQFNLHHCWEDRQYAIRFDASNQPQILTMNFHGWRQGSALERATFDGANLQQSTIATANCAQQKPGSYSLPAKSDLTGTTHVVCGDPKMSTVHHFVVTDDSASVSDVSYPSNWNYLGQFDVDANGNLYLFFDYYGAHVIRVDRGGHAIASKIPNLFGVYEYNDWGQFGVSGNGSLYYAQGEEVVGWVVSHPSSLVGVESSGAIDQAVVDCFNRNGGASAVGQPFANNAPVYVHHASMATGSGVNSQDFQGGALLTGIIMHADGAPNAWLVRSGFRDYYIGSWSWANGGLSTWLGLPVSDEHATPTGSIQQFEHGYTTWNNQTGVIQGFPGHP